MAIRKAIFSIDEVGFPALKYLLVFFDKVYCMENDLNYLSEKCNKPAIDRTFHRNQADTHQLITDLKFLREKGLIETVKYNFKKPRTATEKAVHSHIGAISDFVNKKYFKSKPIELHTIIPGWFLQDSKTLIGQYSLATKGITDVCPILVSRRSLEYDNSLKKDVLNVIMKRMPIPDNITPWEQIVEFKSDEDTRTKYLELIIWANKVASSNRSSSEIEDEYEYLYDQYMRHYKLHKMKSNMTTMDVLISAGIDALASFNPAGILKELFSLRKSRISLMEEELKLPGKEIAFIYKANETFGK